MAKAGGKPAKPVPGLERGDHVYVSHPDRGAMAVRVLAKGRDGFTGECDQGKRHQLGFDTYVGHKKRMLQRYDVVDQGVDGALLEDDAGRRRYLAGEVPVANKDVSPANADDAVPDTRDAKAPPQPAAPGSKDDPLLGGMDRLGKSAALFFKAAVANRPGLALKRVTDKAGHQTQRWTKTAVDAPAERKPGQREAGSVGQYHGPRHDSTSPENRAKADAYNRQAAAKGLPPMEDAPDFEGRANARAAGQDPDAPAPAKPAAMKHGDVVSFRHGDVEGKGKIVGSGADGVTVHDGEREHQVRHDALMGPAKDAGAADSSDTPGQPGQGGAGQGSEGGAGGGGGQVPPDTFDAHSYAAQHNDPHVTPADILKQFPPDTEAKMKECCDKIAAAPQTIDTFKKDGKYTPERLKLHNSIIRELMSPERMEAATPADGTPPTFTVLGGRGGSGKSWFEHKVYDPEKAIVLDADAIKQRLPEYEGWNAATVHEESSDLFDRMTEMARTAGLNLVHDATMKTASKAVALVQKFKDDGYRTEAHYMYLPPQEAAKRAVERFLGKTKRLVPPGVVLGNTTNEGSFDQVKKLVDDWSFRDNNVSKGQEPRLISQRSGNEADSGKSGRDGLPASDGPGHGDHPGTGPAADDGQGGGAPGGLQKGFGALGGADGGGVAAPLALFLKATIPGGAMGDLLGQPTNVAGHVKNGKFVGPYTAVRHVAGGPPPAAMHHLAMTPGTTPHIARPVEPPAPAAPAAPRLSETQTRRLAALVNRNTSHEAVLHHPDGSKHLLGYLGRKSNQGLLDATSKRGKHVTSVLGIGPDARMTVGGKHELHVDGGGKIAFSGRTQRQAILEGEHPYIGDYVSPATRDDQVQADVAAMTPQALPMPQKSVEDMKAEQLAAYQAGKAAREAAAAPAPAPAVDGIEADARLADAKHFYVSAIDGPRRHLVAGPYASHEEAKSRVAEVRKHAEYDPRSHWMAWGTAGSATPMTTPLGENWKA